MKKLAIYGMALAVAGLWSCSADDVKNPAQQVGDNTIKLSGSILSTRAISDPQSNALSANVKVGAFATAPDGDLTNEVNNQYSVVDKSFSAVSKDMTAEDCSSVSVYAYAPFSDGWTLGSNTFTVSANQSDETGYLASDLLHAKAENQNPENVVNLGFTHKLAQLVVKFNNAAEIDLSNATVSVLNTLPSITLNTQDGTMGTATGTPTSITGAVNVGQNSVYTVLVPQTVNAGSDFVKVSRSGYLDLVAQLGENVNFEGGKSYTMTVTLSDGGAAIAIGGISLSDWAEGTTFEAEAQEKEPEPLYATFGTPASNASYTNGVYSWTASSSNLMTVFEFPNGELDNYSDLTFTISNLTSGAAVRIGYYVGKDFTEIGTGYYSDGKKTVDLSTLDIDLSTVTSIAFGGKTGGDGGSVTILASEMYLTPKKGYVPPTTDPGNSGDSGNNGGGTGTTTSFPQIALESCKAWSNGGSTLENGVFNWVATSNNGVNLYTVTGSENISEYKTIHFTLQGLPSDNSGFIRFGYQKSGESTRTLEKYYSNGDKIVDISSWNLSTGDVITIAGPDSGTSEGSVTISNLYFSKEAKQ